jgi:uncharacterized integral membrane protein
MPWKLLFFIIVMAVVLIFIGLNLDNRCDISLAFHTLRNVPVVVTILASFLLGLLMAFPLSIVRRSSTRQGRHVPIAPARVSHEPPEDRIVHPDQRRRTVAGNAADLPDES